MKCYEWQKIMSNDEKDYDNFFVVLFMLSLRSFEVAVFCLLSPETAVTPQGCSKEVMETTTK